MNGHDFAATLVALGSTRTWLDADEIRGLLKAHLGVDATAQQVAGWLTRMTNEDAPRFERRRHRWSPGWEYRVTRFGCTDIENKLPNLRARERPTGPAPVSPVELRTGG
jgi:hypothetical protein